MPKKIKSNFKINFVKLLGAFGYLACAVQWLWALVLYSNSLKSYLTSITPVVEKPVVHQSANINVTDGGSNILFLVLGTIVTVSVIGLSIYLAIKTPTTIVKTAKKVVYETAETVTPVVLHIQHKEETVRNKRKVSFSIRMIVKIILITLPFIGALTSQLTPNPLFSGSFILLSSVVLLGISAAFFILQYVTASLFRMKSKKFDSVI
jgi:hypothetical protein